jgi:hypothetical protein
MLGIPTIPVVPEQSYVRYSNYSCCTGAELC